MAQTDPALVAEIRRRRWALESELERRGIAAAVLSSHENFLYLTGYTTPSWANRARPMALVVRPGRPALAVVSAAEADRATEEGVDLEAIPYLEPVLVDDEFPRLEFVTPVVDAVSSALPSAGTIALELSSSFVSCLPPTAVESFCAERASKPVDLAPLLWRLRGRKSAWELERMRRAAAALGVTYERFATEAHSGLSERELHRIFLAAAASSGADAVGYLVVVAGADRPLLGPPGDRVWQSGDLLLVDAGLLVEGYWSDFSRIFAAIDPTVEQAVGYTRLLEALDAGRENALVGSATKAVAIQIAAALGAARSGAFGRYGHGIGLSLTEPPSLQASDPGQLEAGAAICVEPSGRFPGVGTLVAEETIAVTDAGPVLLSPPFPRVLPVLG